VVKFSRQAPIAVLPITVFDTAPNQPMILAVMFELVTPYQPAGDQPQAIAKLTDGILSGAKHQTLPGVTSSERHSRWRTRA
jgi:hypothetical protein